MAARRDITTRIFEVSDLDAVRDLIRNTIDVCYSLGYTTLEETFLDLENDENLRYYKMQKSLTGK